MMNATQARQILLRYRPGCADENDPEIAEALALARQDESLRLWLEQHCAFQTALRDKLRGLPEPEELKARLLAARPVIRPRAWWRRPAWQAAAALVFLLGLAGLWWWPVTTASPGRFSNYQARMVGTVLRQYRMDVTTNDHRVVRQLMAAGGAPADYTLPRGLEPLALTGGGLLRWENNPVAMICFNRGDDEMLFLFVMDRAAVNDPPPATPRLAKVNKLLTASWSAGDRIYVLAGPEEADFLGKYR